MLWNYELDEIECGYHKTKDQYSCVLCGKTFEIGKVYAIGNEMYDAYGAVKKHVETAHGGAAEYLLAQEASVNGMSEMQKRMVSMMLAKKTDKEISLALGISASTVRNHKFKLREKRKQAKIFLALMDLVEQNSNQPMSSSDQGEIEEVHTAATMIDDRYAITDSERDKTIKTYLDDTGKMLKFPSKEKKKIIVLREIMKNFTTQKDYEEKEINRILKRIYEEDYVSIRRALIEYGFLDRSRDCRIYRVKE